MNETTAVHWGIKTPGLSRITNLSAGIPDQPITHGEAQAGANGAKARFAELADPMNGDVV